MPAKFYIEPVRRKAPWSRGDKGNVRVSLVAANGKVLTSGEALAGDPHHHIDAIRAAAAEATVVDERGSK